MYVYKYIYLYIYYTYNSYFFITTFDNSKLPQVFVINLKHHYLRITEVLLYKIEKWGEIVNRSYEILP